MASKDDDELAKEKDLKFKLWLQNKALKDKAFELLVKLDSSRASDDDKLIEVGIALCAIDRILGVDDSKPVIKAQTNENDGEATPPSGKTNKTEPSPANKKTLKHAWMKWTMEFHSFSMLILPESDLINLSEAVKEFMFSEAELAGNAGNDPAGLSKVKNILPSLKYFFPTIPKPGEKPKPLTKDQKMQNIIYMRELKKFWKKCKDELDNRVTEYVAKAMKTKYGLDYDPDAMDRERQRKEQMSKLRAGGSAYSSNGSNRSEQPSSSTSQKTEKKLIATLEIQCLHELSLKQLKQWVEEDEDKKLTEEQEANTERLKMAKISHEQFVKKKDGLRIRMPENMLAVPSAAMSYGKEFSGVRPQGKTVQTTVELMAGMGLKYVHATNKGRKGMEGDLEKSRNQLLKLGYVNKENFNEDSLSQYYREKEGNATNVEKQSLEIKLRQDNSKAYDDWLQMKDLHENAIKGINLLSKPKWKNENLAFFSSTFQRQSVTSLYGGGGAGGERGGGGSGIMGNNTNTMRRSISSGNNGMISQTQQALLQGGVGASVTSLQSNTQQQAGTTASTAMIAANNRAKLQFFYDQITLQPDIFQYCIDMGKILKQIDRLLFHDWCKWCDQIIPNSIATIVWDYFPPISCDVHTVAYSQIRETFFKLLRPGIDYREYFLNYVYKHILYKRIEKVKENKDYYHIDDEEEKQEIESELESLKKEWLQNVSLTKEQLKQLLLQLGITLKGYEMNTLIDAFDSNGDGVITITEFLDFCGPKRDKKSGNALIICHQKCCWLTTCKLTGMPNGYRISNPTKRLLQLKLQSEIHGKEQAEQVSRRKSEEVRKRMQANDDNDVYEEELDNGQQDDVNKLDMNYQYTGKVVMKTLTNGELRMCIELKERIKREEILKRLGLLSDREIRAAAAGTMGSEESKKKQQDDEYAEDDYDEYSGDEHQLHGSKGGSKSGGKKEKEDNTTVQQCAYNAWTFKDRMKAMKELNSITRDAREEQLVKQMIANGKPPSAPKLWVDMKPLLQKLLMQQQQGGYNEEEDNENENEEEDDEDEDEIDALMRSTSSNQLKKAFKGGRGRGGKGGKSGKGQLILQWCSGETNELVSFYSIEFAGPVASVAVTTINGNSGNGSNGGSSKLGDVKYTEIFRDPPDAQLQNQFMGQYILKQLLPGTTYRFRIRAVNGFGPGEYTYKTFTTLTIAPSCPVITKITSNSVTLRWTFTKYFLNRMKELKTLFLLADKDKSGDISREELLTIFDTQLKAGEYKELQDFIHRFMKSKGFSVPQDTTNANANDGEGNGDQIVTMRSRNQSHKNVIALIKEEENKQQQQQRQRQRTNTNTNTTDNSAQQRYGVLFDCIESDDDDRLTWIEFEKFFLSLGWTNAAGEIHDDNNNNNNTATTASYNPNSSQTLQSTAGGGGKGGNKTVKESDVVYVIERCESEFDDIFKEIIRTSQGYATINHLNPGESYRFRIYSLNADELRGPSSPSIVVHTLLETPPPPIPKQITSRTLLLQWKPRLHSMNTRNQAFISRMVEDWTHAHNEQDKGVSIEAIFAKYDRNASGDIDATELALVLEDLGVKPTEERLAQAFHALDTNSDGIISFEEFSKWWRQEQVMYILKRSEEIAPLVIATTIKESNTATNGGQQQRAISRGPTRSNTSNKGGGDDNASVASSSSSAIGGRSLSRSRRPSLSATATATGIAAADTTGSNNISTTTTTKHVPVPIVVSRDTKTRYEVHGLTPNALYHFKVRYLGPRSNSILSNPLVIMTTPLPPTCPILIDVTATTVRIKWYPKEYGAYKFLVQMRLLPSPNATTTANANANNAVANDWMQVYNGCDTLYTNTTLASETLYEVRVFALNYQGQSSESSNSLKFLTLSRNDTTCQLTVKNMNTTFTIECTGDICVGDTILITERLFLKPSSNNINNASMLRSSTTSQVFIPTANNKTKPTIAAKPFAATHNNPNNSLMMPSTTGDGNITITGDTAGQFIGERTIACYVSKDNYRSTRDSLSIQQITPKQSRLLGGYRQLWLEVIWQKSTTEACKRYDVKIGDVLERLQGHLEQFEVYRVPWAQEKMRLSLSEEWNLLKECYRNMDC